MLTLDVAFMFIILLGLGFLAFVFIVKRHLEELDNDIYRKVDSVSCYDSKASIGQVVKDYLRKRKDHNMGIVYDVYERIQEGWSNNGYYIQEITRISKPEFDILKKGLEVVEK